MYHFDIVPTSPQRTHPHPVDGVHRPARLALVFGREELGMSDEEVAECDAVCSIPIGRLQVRAHQSRDASAMACLDDLLAHCGTIVQTGACHHMLHRSL